jgi:transposase
MQTARRVGGECCDVARDQANVVHKWRRLANVGSMPVSDPGFIAVALPAPVATPAQDIRVQLRRGATTMTITWPVASAGDCALWMRELLR